MPRDIAIAIRTTNEDTHDISTERHPNLPEVTSDELGDEALEDMFDELGMEFLDDTAPADQEEDERRKCPACHRRGSR